LEIRLDVDLNTPPAIAIWKIANMLKVLLSFYVHNLRTETKCCLTTDHSIVNAPDGNAQIGYVDGNTLIAALLEASGIGGTASKQSR
jgi:hypothetical protein